MVEHETGEDGHGSLLLREFVRCTSYDVRYSYDVRCVKGQPNEERMERPQPATEPRVPLSKERVLDAAVTLADREGLESCAMRRLADELGAGAMSLYHYVSSKDELIDRDGRHRLRRDRAAVDGRRLEDGDAAVCDLETQRAEPPPLGGRPPGVASDARSRELPSPQRRARLPPRSVLGRDDDPGVLGPRRLHLRLRAPGEDGSVRERGGSRSGRGRAGTRVRGRRRSNNSSRRSRTSSPTSPRSSPDTSPTSATTSQPRSSTASTSSSTRSRSAALQLADLQAENVGREDPHGASCQGFGPTKPAGSYVP